MPMGGGPVMAPKSVPGEDDPIMHALLAAELARHRGRDGDVAARETDADADAE
jgi:hypothetical protein